MKKRKPWVIFYVSTIVTVLLLAQWGSRAVTVIAESTPIQREHCIIIDAGHGGEDGGAVSCTGKPESAYNLSISLRLNDLFHFLGYETKMIRTTDKSVYTKGETLAQKKISDLRERVRIVQETENGILLSIHQNLFPDSRYHGAQVFYGKGEGSEELAAQLQNTFTSALHSGENRKIKKTEGVYIMERITCPGALIECGFLSNPMEEAKLGEAEYQKQICCVIISSVDQYLSNT